MAQDAKSAIHVIDTEVVTASAVAATAASSTRPRKVRVVCLTDHIHFKVHPTDDATTNDPPIPQGVPEYLIVPVGHAISFVTNSGASHPVYVTEINTG